MSALKGIDGNHDDEGRFLTLEYEDFFLDVLLYPKSQRNTIWQG